MSYRLYPYLWLSHVWRILRRDNQRKLLEVSTDTPITQLESAFDRLFTAYADPWRFTTTAYEQKRLESVMTLIPPTPHALLDIGCAEGDLTARLAKHFPSAHIIGTDVSRVALNRARVRYPGLTFIHHRAGLDTLARLPHRPYDVIILTEVLFYIRGKARSSFLEELEQHLTDHGSIIIGFCPRYHQALLRQLKKKFLLDTEIQIGSLSWTGRFKKRPAIHPGQERGYSQETIRAKQQKR